LEKCNVSEIGLGVTRNQEQPRKLRVSCHTDECQAAFAIFTAERSGVLSEDGPEDGWRLFHLSVPFTQLRGEELVEANCEIDVDRGDHAAGARFGASGVSSEVNEEDWAGFLKTVYLRVEVVDREGCVMAQSSTLVEMPICDDFKPSVGETISPV
jgi:hypothetical protein